MTLTYRTKNPWHITDDLLVLRNRTDGVKILAAEGFGVLNHTWCIHYKNGKVTDVRTMIPDPHGGRTSSGHPKRLTLGLHTLIMENVPHRPDQTEIDHLNGDPSDNRLDNLRHVTRSVNAQNKRDANGMPLRGVSYKEGHYRTRPWRARITVDGKEARSKHFSTAREAEKQFLIWKRQYHPETPEIWYEQYAACQASGYWD